MLKKIVFLLVVSIVFLGCEETTESESKTKGGSTIEDTFVRQSWRLDNVDVNY